MLVVDEDADMLDDTEWVAVVDSEDEGVEVGVAVELGVAEDV